MGAGTSRSVVVLVAAAALVAGPMVAGVAQAAPAPGTGSSSGAVSLFDVTLGSDALDLRLLGEDSHTSNDPSAGGPSASERVSPLQATSSLVPALADISQPTAETSSTSGEDTTSTPGVDLAALLAGAPVPGLLTGTVDPTTLRSAVDTNGAVSAATGALHDVAVLGGFVSVGTISAQLGSSALSTDAGASRSAQLDRLDVLDLTALLDALGISLADLPIGVAVELLAQLGLPLPGGLSPADLLATIDGLLADTSAVRAQVTILQGEIDDLQVELATLTSQLSVATAAVASLTSQLAEKQALLATCVVLTPLLCEPIQALVTSLTSQLTLATASVASIDAAIVGVQNLIDGFINQIQDLLATISAALDELVGLLDSITAGLEGAALLTVDDLAVAVTVRADDTLSTSVATVVGSVRDVRIGGLSLGGLDAGSTPAQFVALADQVTATLGGILSIIDPSLGDLVDIDLLQLARSLTASDGVVEATASITGLRATVTPPPVCDVLSQLAGVDDSLGGVLVGLGETLPVSPGPVGDVLRDLGSTADCTAETGNVVNALTQPLTVTALSVAGASVFAATLEQGSGTPTTPGELPATGGSAGFAPIALGLAVVAIAMRRLLLSADRPGRRSSSSEVPT